MPHTRPAIIPTIPLPISAGIRTASPAGHKVIPKALPLVGNEVPARMATVPEEDETIDESIKEAKGQEAPA